jgi:hypothetical protein
MTDVSQNRAKVDLRHQLKKAAEQALRQEGWSVEKVSGSGKSSLRRITRGSASKVVSIRTTQDTWIAFPRIDEQDNFGTLPEVDAVVASSVNDRDDPQVALVHLLDGEEMRARFNRAVKARKSAGYNLPIGRGIWIALYEEEQESPANKVGAGAGLANPPIARIPLNENKNLALPQKPTMATEAMTIPEAKRRLAAAFGVEPSNVKITIEG